MTVIDGEIVIERAVEVRDGTLAEVAP